MLQVEFPLALNDWLPVGIPGKRRRGRGWWRHKNTNSTQPYENYVVSGEPKVITQNLRAQQNG
jgi:hypothetical protein